MPANQSTFLSSDPVPEALLTDPQTVQTLQDAAATFIHNSEGTTEIWAASRDWFLEEWGRDTFISLPGLLLATGRFDEARQVFKHFAKYEHDGLIPNVIRNDQLMYNTVDASLWFIHALQAYLKTTKDRAFVEQLMPTVRNIINGYMHGTAYEHAGSQHRIYMDASDGLIVSPAQATWMDADPAGDGTTIVTPRNGKCVEINALWYAALNFAISFDKHLDKATKAELTKCAHLVKASFVKKFWNEENGCLYDVIEGDPHGAAIRPNQIIAVAVGGDLLSNTRQAQILDMVRRELLMPGGLRSLAASDLEYKGHYNTFDPIPVKDLAYHQGTIWPWLIGPYCDAVWQVRDAQGKKPDATRREIEDVIGPLVRFCLESEYKSLPELFAGDPPYDAGGTTSQAWSIAEVLRHLSKLA